MGRSLCHIPAAGVRGGAGPRSPEICCSLTTACHPPHYYSNPHYREMSSHSNTTTTQRCYTAPWGDRAFFWSCRREQSEQHGRRVDAFWSFSLGVQPSQMSTSSLLSVLIASIVVLPDEKAAGCLLGAWGLRLPLAKPGGLWSPALPSASFIFVARHLPLCWAHVGAPSMRLAGRGKGKWGRGGTRMNAEFGGGGAWLIALGVLPHPPLWVRQ